MRFYIRFSGGPLDGEYRTVSYDVRPKPPATVSIGRVEYDLIKVRGRVIEAEYVRDANDLDAVGALYLEAKPFISPMLRSLRERTAATLAGKRARTKKRRANNLPLDEAAFERVAYFYNGPLDGAKQDVPKNVSLANRIVQFGKKRYLYALTSAELSRLRQQTVSRYEYVGAYEEASASEQVQRSSDDVT